MMDLTVGDRVTRRLTSLEGDRALHAQRWRDSYDHTFPERSDHFWNVTGAPSDDRRKKAEQVDGTGRDAAKTLAAGMVGGLVPANMQWFDLDDSDGAEEVEANAWLSESARFIWRAIHASNFDAIAVDCFIDAVCAGWFVCYVEEDPNGGYWFEWWPIGECYVAASKYGRPIDTVYRRYAMSVEQCVAEYGFDAVSPATQKAFADGNYDRKVEMVYAIEPRRSRRPGSPMARDLPFAAYHVECASKHVCREGGFHEFPCAVPRVRPLPGSHYAIGPNDDALPDIKTLQALGQAELQAAELAIGGVWKARDDGVLNPHSIRIGPRRVIAVADMANLERLDMSNPRGAQQAWTAKTDLQRQIRTTMMTDHLQPQDKPQMTAYEVHVRVQMIRALLGPHFGRFQSEFLATIVGRCFGIALRAGVLGDPPADLQSYAIKYTSPLARAQQLEDAEATQAYMAYLIEQATATGDTSVLDIIDKDAANRHVADGKGVPTNILREPGDIAERRRMREESERQQQQAEQQQATQMMAAEGAAKRMGAAA